MRMVMMVVMPIEESDGFFMRDLDDRYLYIPTHTESNTLSEGVVYLPYLGMEEYGYKITFCLISKLELDWIGCGSLLRNS